MLEWRKSCNIVILCCLCFLMAIKHSYEFSFHLPSQLIRQKSSSSLSLHAKKMKKLISDEALGAILEQEASQQHILPGKTEVMLPRKPIEGEAIVERRKSPNKFARFAENSGQPVHVGITFDKVSFYHGNQQVLKDLSFTVSTGEKAALLGPNGIGKSTALKLLGSTGSVIVDNPLTPTSGSISITPAHARISYLNQEFEEELLVNETVYNNLMAVFPEEMAILNRILALEQLIENCSANTSESAQYVDELSDLHKQANSLGTHGIESKVDKVLNTVGFAPDDKNRLVSCFSGGWKMKIGLAKLLLQEPNVLLLDEPTNHLDIDAVLWLEKFLVNIKMPIIIVSHDREFIDQVCNKIIDLQDSVAFSFHGNYSSYVLHRDQQLISWRNAYAQQQREIATIEAFIKKHANDGHFSQAVKAKQTTLERLRSSPAISFSAAKENELIPEPPKEKKFRFRFPDIPRCGKAIFELNQVSHGYHINEEGIESKSSKLNTILKNVNFEVEKGDRIGIIGRNGVGKSTLLRLLAGIEEPLEGNLEVGSANVKIGYYSQNQADSLDMDLTIVESIQQAVVDSNRDNPTDEYMSVTEVRTLLGQFMFKGDSANKKIKVLSGGEKSRVALCRLLVRPANVLLLDEPTNHLDIVTKGVLEEALMHFDGTLVVVSHDRHFMGKTVNKIIEFDDSGKIQVHHCDYHDYLQKKSPPDLLKKVTTRYVNVKGSKIRIENAQLLNFEEKQLLHTKNFGGSGVTSGKIFKGTKNAKRYYEK